MENLTIRDAFKSLEDIDDSIVEIKPKKRIQESLNDSYIYLFPDDDSMGDYKEECKKFGLKYLGKNHFNREMNLVIEGPLSGIQDYAEYLTYELHPNYLYTSDEFAGDIIKEEVIKEEPTYDMRPEYDFSKSFYGKARVDIGDNGVKVCKSYGTPVAMIKDGKAYLLQGVINYYGYRTSATTLRHVKEFLKQNGFKAESLKQIENDYDVISDYGIYKTMLGESVEQPSKKDVLQESELINVGDKEEIEKGKDIIEKGKENDDTIEQIVDVDAETIGELKDSYIGNVILQCPICRTLLYKKPDALEQSEDDAEIYNVEEECPHCGAKEGFYLVGQVASLEVKGVEKEETTGKDVSELTVSDDDQDTVKVEKETEEVTFESLDETKFNKLVNKYVKNIYENVEDYTTTSGSVDDDNNKLVIEGVITYKSGKTANTKFMFESISMTKDQTIKFKGLNETFIKAKKPFTLVATVKDNTLNCEALNYNYTVKVNEELKKVKGKVNLSTK